MNCGYSIRSIYIYIYIQKANETCNDSRISLSLSLPVSVDESRCINIYTVYVGFAGQLISLFLFFFFFVREGFASFPCRYSPPLTVIILRYCRLSIN